MCSSVGGGVGMLRGWKGHYACRSLLLGDFCKIQRVVIFVRCH